MATSIDSTFAALKLTVQVCIALLFIANNALAEVTQTRNSVGMISHLMGTVSRLEPNSENLVRLKIHDALYEGDTLISQQNSYSRIKFRDGGNLILRSNSELKIETYHFKKADPEQDQLAIHLLKGSLRFITGLAGKRNPEDIQIQTPLATINLEESTHLGLLLCQQNDGCADDENLSGKKPHAGLYIDVLQGSASVFNDTGRRKLNTGQFSHTADYQSSPRLIAKEEAVRIPIPSEMVTAQ